MGKPPAVIIIARHGTRLDAADKKWHLTSPTPYDPPLTFGGWLQARALGNRIASILQTRAEEQQAKDAPTNGDAQVEGGRHLGGADSKPKKQKIIIHSSPYLRCIQTSIAISAGIGQQRKGPATSTTAATKYVHNALRSRSPRWAPRDESPTLSAMSEPDDHLPAPPKSPAFPPAKHRIAQLRIDAFLGEWLSPDYFENITPPPSSVVMVANAKVELMRPGEVVANANISARSLQGCFPGGWSRDRSPASSIDIDEEEKHGLSGMAALGHSLPNRTRAVSHTSPQLVMRSDSSDRSLLSANSQDEALTYVPPIPTYAVSSSDPIPAGYVAHARDACLDIKFQWDSMRPPQDWGNGGEYGEEWSSMHRRFRGGLQRMVAWYEETGSSTSIRDGQLVAEEDSDDETVLILVTHGAGCNALIGALTNLPVLLDVGMASLTMAVRRSSIGDVKPTITLSPTKSRRGSIDLGIADEYDVKLTASTEHLRAVSTPMGLPSPRFGSSPTGSTRRSYLAPISDEFTIGDPLPSRPNGTEGLHRSASGTHGMRPFLGPSSKMSSGLWRSETAHSQDATTESSDSDMLPRFEISTPMWSKTRPNTSITKPALFEEDAPDAPASAVELSSRTKSQRGLWGGATYVREDSMPKRRWTSAEH